MIDTVWTDGFTHPFIHWSSDVQAGAASLSLHHGCSQLWGNKKFKTKLKDFLLRMLGPNNVIFLWGLSRVVRNGDGQSVWCSVGSNEAVSLEMGHPEGARRRGSAQVVPSLIRMDCLPSEVLQAHRTGKIPLRRSRTQWRDYISHLAWERLGFPQDELGGVAGEGNARLACCNGNQTPYKWKKMAGWCTRETTHWSGSQLIVFSLPDNHRMSSGGRS